jgi:hypothetical protein
MAATFNISIKTLREAIVTNNSTGVKVQCKVEPYHRDGKRSGYVVLEKELEAPQRRYNIKDFNGPVELKNVTMTGKSRSNVDWSDWGK